MLNLIFYSVVFGLIGARAYYVAFNWSYYSTHLLEILEVWNGGLAIHGGIFAGLLWIIFYTKKYKISTLKILDIAVVGLMIGQCIGRWGNFFNQEAYGAVTTLEALQGMYLRISSFKECISMEHTAFQRSFTSQFGLSLDLLLF